MPFARGSNTTATQATALYAQLETLLTAAGWVELGETSAGAIVYNNIGWHVWRNPAANSGLLKDFHVAIGFATSGTGSMYFRLFEDWVGLSADPVTDQYEYGCMRPVPNPQVPTPNTLADDWGKNLKDQTAYYGSEVSGSWNPIPSTTAWDYTRHDSPPYYDSVELDPLQVPSPDFSVGIWSREGPSGRYYYSSDGVAEALNEAAPHVMDFRSFWLDEETLGVDDETAVEYVFHVSAKCILLGTYRVFNNLVDNVYIGVYEDHSPYDPCPIIMRAVTSGVDNAAFTRYWGWADQPTDPGKVQGGYHFRSDGLSFLTSVSGRPTTDLSNKTTGTISIPFKAPTSSRLQVVGLGTQFRGILPVDVMGTYMPVQNDVPPVDFGDETLINGVPYVHIYVQGYGRMPNAAGASNPSQVTYWGVWARKD